MTKRQAAVLRVAKIASADPKGLNSRAERVIEEICSAHNIDVGCWRRFWRETARKAMEMAIAERLDTKGLSAMRRRQVRQALMAKFENNL